MQVSQELVTVMSLLCRVDVPLVFKDNLIAVKVEVYFTISSNGYILLHTKYFSSLSMCFDMILYTQYQLEALSSVSQLVLFLLAAYIFSSIYSNLACHRRFY